MYYLATAVIVSILNMVYAAVIYLSLHGWLVVHEPSGMQLLMHLFVTTPVVFVTTIWMYYLSKDRLCNSKFWKLNLVGLVIPIMSVQTGITYYHFDIVGLVVSVLVAIGLAILLLGSFRQRVHS